MGEKGQCDNLVHIQLTQLKCTVIVMTLLLILAYFYLQILMNFWNTVTPKIIGPHAYHVSLKGSLDTERLRTDYFFYSFRFPKVCLNCMTGSVYFCLKDVP